MTQGIGLRYNLCGLALIVSAHASAGTADVNIVSHHRSLGTQVEVISDFGCNDFIFDGLSAPDANPWNESLTTAADCGFEPDAFATSTATQVSELSPVRLAASGTIEWSGEGSEYSDPESKEFFCSGAGGGGDINYTVTFDVLAPVAYRIVGSLDTGGNGDAYVELNRASDQVFIYSFGESFDDSGTLAPGRYTLFASSYLSESAQICGGGAGGCAQLAFVLDLTPPCPADLDASGGVDFGDLVALLSVWGPCGASCAADLDDSGDVSFNDLLILLSSWGACP